MKVYRLELPPIVFVGRMTDEGAAILDKAMPYFWPCEVVVCASEREVRARMSQAANQLVTTTPGTWFTFAWGWFEPKNWC